jgi:hypothetical protein
MDGENNKTKKSQDFQPDVFMIRFKCKSKLLLCYRSSVKTRSHFYVGLKLQKRNISPTLFDNKQFEILKK